MDVYGTSVLIFVLFSCSSLSFCRPDSGLRPPVQQVRERVKQSGGRSGTGEEAEHFLQTSFLLPSGLLASGTLLRFCFGFVFLTEWGGLAATPPFTFTPCPVFLIDMFTS